MKNWCEILTVFLWANLVSIWGQWQASFYIWAVYQVSFAGPSDEQKIQRLIETKRLKKDSKKLSNWKQKQHWRWWVFWQGILIGNLVHEKIGIWRA